MEGRTASFILRLYRNEKGQAEGFAGIVEDPVTGLKKAFRSGEELLCLLEGYLENVGSQFELSTRRRGQACPLRLGGAGWKTMPVVTERITAG